MTRTLMATVLCLMVSHPSGGAGVSAVDAPGPEPDATIEAIPGYRLVWHDEFDADGPPDPVKWSLEQGFVRNNELQWYQRQNASCRDGRLVIEGRKERVANARHDPQSKDWRKSRAFADYTSASLNTWGRSAWQLSTAIVTVRARITPQPGYFPAIWTTGPGAWPHGGEVDLMEYYGGRILANFAWGTERQWVARWHPFDNPNHGDRNKPKLTYFTERDPRWTEKFHVWKLVGSETGVRIFLDGELMNEVSHETARNPKTEWSGVVHPFKEKHSLILNLAIGGPGGDPSGAKLPYVYEVDYARVHQAEQPTREDR